ncbi:MAG: PCMD domain-containing protein, partial [Bacteroides sp.]
GTAKADYTEFNIPFTFVEGKTYEAGAKYKMAIVCSSSKEGDKFKGAVGSTLIVDELEVIGE